MRTRRFRILLPLLLIVGVGIAWLLLRKPENQTIILPSGSKLTLVKVTCGANHSCAYGDGWREWIYPILPHRFRTNFTAKVASLTSTATNGVVVWIRLVRNPSPTNLLPVLPRITGLFTAPSVVDEALSVVDEHRLESSLILPKAKFDASLGTGLYAYELGNRPRRATMFTVLVYWRKGLDQKTARVGEFTIPNRQRRNFPVWTPETLPVSKLTNGLEVTLTKFETGLKQSEARMFAAVGDRASAFSRATIMVKENGVPASEWNVDGAEVTSATGDFWPMQSSASWGQGLKSVDFLGSLWWEEPAFKLRIVLSHFDARRKQREVEFIARPETPNALAQMR